MKLLPDADSFMTRDSSLISLWHEGQLLRASKQAIRGALPIHREANDAKSNKIHSTPIDFFVASKIRDAGAELTVFSLREHPLCALSCMTLAPFGTRK